MAAVLILSMLGVLCLIGGVAVMLLNSGTLFFAVWYALGAALLGAAWAVRAGLWAALPAAVRGVTLAVLGVCLLVGTGLLGLVLSGFGAAGEPDLDYVVVLGAQVQKSGRPSPVLRYRLDAALAYLEENPRTICIVSGGQGPNEPMTEAEGMAIYLTEHGIARERILEEGASESTLQNITNSMALMSSADARVGVVTNNFHVLRAVRTARKAGLRNACGIAGYSTPAYLPNNLLREVLGCCKDLAVGNIEL